MNPYTKKINELVAKQLSSLSEQDKKEILIRYQGAKELIDNKVFNEFLVKRRIELLNSLSVISGNEEKDNQLRIKLGIELNALVNFVRSIQASVIEGDKLINMEKGK